MGKRQNPPLPPPTPSISGFATPMPDWAPMSTPAWDPSSRTPQAAHDETPSHHDSALPESSPASSQEHHLFDR